MFSELDLLNTLNNINNIYILAILSYILVDLQSLHTVITMFTWTVVVLWGDNSNIAGFGSKLSISNKIVRVNAR